MKTTDIYLSAPSENKISVGIAASCRPGEFYGYELIIFNKERTNSISAYVSNGFPCLDSDKDEDKIIGKLILISSVALAL